MGNKFQQQIKVVSREDIRPGTATMEAAFFDANGNPVTVGVTPAAYVAPIATADGSDATTTQALANATKTTVNGIIAALVAADLMASA